MAITLSSGTPARHDRAVVFSADGAYLRFALFAAIQIADRHPARDFDICIVSAETLSVPASLAGRNLRICQLDDGGVFDSLNLDYRRTSAVYMRLALPEAFATDYRRLLYLDADVFVQGGDFAALLEVGLGPHPIGAVRDNIQWRSPGRKAPVFATLGLPGAAYFNSGLLLIDVERFRETDLMRRCIHLAQTSKRKIPGHDQNLLNGVLRGGWAELSPLWNWQYTRDSVFFEAMEDANIVHFIGAKKPWRHASGAMPRRFRRAYRDFFATHMPEGPQIGPDGKAPHENRAWLRKSLLRHAVSMSRFCDYLDRFEDDMSVIT